ncbi:Receptor-type tyrosine-protein phosphatase alpha [Holothuria leucospilota]|uniref:protein-tyrosine-phosphatase n=1 Tax=Holothuria leucospilota TaxID=206669 RepID=A0A9Q1H8Y2_HOLLE|nr:Receptor-type tyrosine-protein phosphatase alpha [Holothuria leucospilota]
MGRLNFVRIFISLYIVIYSVNGQSCDVEPTGKPTILESEKVGITSMKLKIGLTFPGEGSNWPDCPTVPFRFRVTYAIEKRSPETKLFDGTSNELLITKLTSCEKYHFKVAVQLSDGSFGPESDVNKNITDTHAPTTPPVLKKVRPSGSKSFRATWAFQEVGTHCNVNKPFDYKMYWSSTEVADEGIKAFNESVTGNTIRATLSDFRPCTEYSFYITVVNFAGRESRPSNKITAEITGPAPSIISTAPVLDTITMLPVGSAGKGQLHITWTFDDSQVVCAYSFVIYWKEEGSTTIDELPIWGGARDANVTGLNTCTVYEINLKTANKDGVLGPESNTLSERTSSGRPETPPTLTSLTPLEDVTGKLRIAWEFEGQDRLQCDASLGFQFILHYIDTSHGGNSTAIPIPESSKRSVHVSGLRTCTEYEISIGVMNIVGVESLPSTSMRQYTLSEKPDTPPEVILVTQVQGKETELQVTWVFDGVRDLHCDPSTDYFFRLYYFSTENPSENGNITITDHTIRTATITGLQQCIIYSISMSVTNIAGVESEPGPSVQQASGSKKPTISPKVESVIAVAGSTSQLQVSWTLPEPKWDWLQCDPAKYDYSFIVRYVDQDKLQDGGDRTTRDAEGFLKLPKDSLETVISDLAPCTRYSVSVTVMNIAEKESDPTSGDATTNSEKPDVVPTILSLDVVGPTALHLNWKALEGMTGESLRCDPKFGYSFVVSYSSLYDVTHVREVGSNQTDLEIINLQPCTEYNFTLAVKNRVNMVGDGATTTNRTGSVPSGPVLSLQYTVSVEFGIEMTWLPPDTHCNVTMYKIQYTLSLFDQCQEQAPSWTEVVLNGTKSLNFTIREVEDFSTYDFMITPFVDSTIAGETRNLSVVTGEGVPDKLPFINFTYGGKRRAVARWNPLECGHRRGEVWYEYKLWILGDKVPEEWAITYETINVFKFLKRGRTYNITVRTATSKGASDQLVAQVTIPEGARFLILALIIALLLLLLLALLLFLLCRRRGRWKKYSVRRMSQQDAEAVVDQDDTDSVIYENTAFENSLVIVPASFKQQSLSKLSPPIPMEYFPLYLRERREGDGKLFKMDFEELTQPGNDSRIEASKEENRMKNRHSKLLPYDSSRVVLEKSNEDSSSDYINASYIGNYEQEKFYIATQGPNSVTKGDFWRMILQEDCNTIIMLCNLIENNKVTCNRYWPKRGTKNAMFGQLTIILKQEDQRHGFVIRELTVCEEKMPKKKITQFQFTGWPKDGVPKTSRPIWEMLELANKNKQNKKNKGPIVVHCSDGCGRTGAVIAMDAMQKQYESDGKIDIAGFVNQMREKRPGMVQDQAQYEFIFDAIFEKYFVRDAVLKCTTYHEMLKSWHSNRDITRLYKMLDYASQPTLNINSSGHSPENMDKNRYQDNIPRNDFRPFLQTEVGGNSTDYINASLFNGYKEKDLFVATQDPLPDTVDDFWRLVWDYNCRTIVTLEQYDKNDATSPEYWPVKEETEYGPFSVSPGKVNTIANDTITERRFSMSYSAKDENEKSNVKNEVREVKQFAIKDWPRKLHVPLSAKSLLTTAELAMEWQQSLPSSKIIVHCRNGVGRSGTFIAIVNSIEEMKEKHEVNLYTIVKELRSRRPMMVDSLARFTFCYDAIDLYLQDFDTYSNY